jgi:hypothetical protein
VGISEAGGKPLSENPKKGSLASKPVFSSAIAISTAIRATTQATRKRLVKAEHPQSIHSPKKITK